MAIDRQSYRNAMALLGAAVNVITTDGPGGRFGFTASAVCSVTDTPPTLLVCVNREHDSHDPMRDNRVLCVNTLAGTHEDLSRVFAGADQQQARFAAAEWYSLATGAPVLRSAPVAFDCRVIQLVEVGTHSVFFCEVEAIHFGDAREGLIYYGRDYHRIAPAA